MIRPSSTTDKAAARRRWSAPAICLALAAITFVVFGQTLGQDFIGFDDDLYVTNNSIVAQGLTLHGIAWVFTHADCFLYHPLTMLSLMTDAQVYGLHAGGFHFTNVLLHTASVILLFLVLRELTGAQWRSAFVAAVFAIHPLRAESVAWIAERKDVLSGFFFLLTLAAYVHYVAQNIRGPLPSGRWRMRAGVALQTDGGDVAVCIALAGFLAFAPDGNRKDFPIDCRKNSPSRVVRGRLRHDRPGGGTTD